MRTFVTKREPRGPHEQLYQPEIPLSREHAVVPLIWIWILWPAVSGSSCTRTRTVFLYARTHARTHVRRTRSTPCQNSLCVLARPEEKKRHRLAGQLVCTSCGYTHPAQEGRRLIQP